MTPEKNSSTFLFYIFELFTMSEQNARSKNSMNQKVGIMKSFFRHVFKMSKSVLMLLNFEKYELQTFQAKNDGTQKT